MAASVRCNSATAASRYTPSRHRLPNGPCNFRSLEVSGVQSPPVCGCQTFWIEDFLNESRATKAEGERAWYLCACGHHACYHDTNPDRDVISAPSTHYLDSGDVASGLAQYPNEQVLRTFPSAILPGGSLSGPLRQHQLASKAVILSRYHESMAAQAPAASTFPSTVPPSDYCNDPIGLADRGRQPQTSAEAQMTVPYSVGPACAPYSATEVNTLSVSGSPRYDIKISQPPVNTSSAEEDDRSGVSQRAPSSQHNTIGITHDLRNVIQSYARRLDVLENSSFSHVPAEELLDKLELLDGRLLDLECWRADADADAKMQNDADDVLEHVSQSQSQFEERESDSKHSDPQRMDDMEERLSMLENATPSYAYPWDLEVVLLPWGSNLRGLWVPPPNKDGEELPRAGQALRELDGLASPTTSIVPGHERTSRLTASWTETCSVPDRCMLVPKAPGPNSVVFQRLRSRGLVRKVTITESGASHIWNTIFNAFHLFLGQENAAHRACGAAWTSRGYQGLDQPLVPLRKVRRSSYLQFLRPWEMITPTTWNFDFLKSGVLMKTKGKRRLYITTSASYIQSDSGEWSWSWLRLCGLTRTHKLFDVITNEHTDDEDGENTGHRESCWEYNANLDHFPSFEGSTSLFPTGYAAQSHNKHDWRERTAPISPAGISPATSTVSLIPKARHERTHTTPITVSVEESADFLSAKRRGMSSSENNAWSQKRHRLNDSPEKERRAACLTPRWSCEPRSPSIGYEAEMQGARHNQATLAHLAYATPHSNTVAAYCTAGGDTEPDSGSSSDQESLSVSSENEWEGVMDDDQEDTTHVAKSSLEHDRDLQDVAMHVSEIDAASSFEDSVMSFEGDETEERDDDLDDGLTIYEAQL